MLTAYTVLRPDGTREEGSVDWPREPTFEQIKALVGPHLNGDPLEHVTVLHQGQRTDMFVSEYGHLARAGRGPLPRNDAATTTYRAAWLSTHPGDNPESMPFIAGPAILFDRRVWF